MEEYYLDINTKYQQNYIDPDLFSVNIYSTNIAIGLSQNILQFIIRQKDVDFIVKEYSKTEGWNPFIFYQIQDLSQIESSDISRIGLKCTLYKIASYTLASSNILSITFDSYTQIINEDEIQEALNSSSIHQLNPLLY